MSLRYGINKAHAWIGGDDGMNTIPVVNAGLTSNFLL